MLTLGEIRPVRVLGSGLAGRFLRLSECAIIPLRLNRTHKKLHVRKAPQRSNTCGFLYAKRNPAVPRVERDLSTNKHGKIV
jgi:hypothetical protein